MYFIRTISETIMITQLDLYECDYSNDMCELRKMELTLGVYLTTILWF